MIEDDARDEAVLQHFRYLFVNRPAKATTYEIAPTDPHLGNRTVNLHVDDVEDVAFSIQRCRNKKAILGERGNNCNCYQTENSCDCTRIRLIFNKFLKRNFII